MLDLLDFNTVLIVLFISVGFFIYTYIIDRFGSFKEFIRCLKWWYGK